jgi:hypothetical protein
MMSLSGSSVAIVLGVPSEPAVGGLYRLLKPLAAVQFDSKGKGFIVILPAKAELRIMGSSSLRNCSEVMYQSGLYNVFNVDVLGCWSTAIRSKRLEPIRAPAAIGACA